MPAMMVAIHGGSIQGFRRKRIFILSYSLNVLRAFVVLHFSSWPFLFFSLFPLPSSFLFFFFFFFLFFGDVSVYQVDGGGFSPLYILHFLVLYSNASRSFSNEITKDSVWAPYRTWDVKRFETFYFSGI